MKLVELTPEGKIILALLKEPRTFADLQKETKLSATWISKKLKELASQGIIRRREDRAYELVGIPEPADDVSSLFAELAKKVAGGLSLQERAQAIASELARRDDVLAIVLFGSVARGAATEESDLDLLIVVREEVDLTDEVYELMLRYDVPIEPIVMAYDEFLSMLASESVFLFSIVEGYRILLDRAGVREALAIKSDRIRSEWVYDEEAGAWFKRSISRT